MAPDIGLIIKASTSGCAVAVNLVYIQLGCVESRGFWVDPEIQHLYHYVL